MTTFNFRGLPDCFVRMIRFFVVHIPPTFVTFDSTSTNEPFPRSLESANVESFPGLNVCPEDSQRKSIQSLFQMILVFGWKLFDNILKGNLLSPCFKRSWFLVENYLTIFSKEISPFPVSKDLQPPSVGWQLFWCHFSGWDRSGCGTLQTGRL